MIDAENLLFGCIASQFPVQLVGGFQITAEWFLHHDALPTVRLIASIWLVYQAGLVQLLHRGTKLARHRGQVKQQVVSEWPVSKTAQLLF